MCPIVPMVFRSWWRLISVGYMMHLCLDLTASSSHMENLARIVALRPFRPLGQGDPTNIRFPQVVEALSLFTHGGGSPGGGPAASEESV